MNEIERMTDLSIGQEFYYVDIENAQELHCDNMVIGNAIDKLAQYENIGTLKQFQDLLKEKQERENNVCPNCEQCKQDRDVGLYCKRFRQYRNDDDFCSYFEAKNK